MARVIFPSYDRDDIWVVNQIRQLPNIVGSKSIGFIDGVDDETLKQDDSAIASWIKKQMKRCSCLILFCGEQTYTSKWVKYELELASKNKMGRFIIHLDGMKCPFRDKVLFKGTDPYSYNGMYTDTPTKDTYTINQYSWKSDNGIDNLSYWIEDACKRANR